MSNEFSALSVRCSMKGIMLFRSELISDKYLVQLISTKDTKHVGLTLFAALCPTKGNFCTIEALKLKEIS